MQQAEIHYKELKNGKIQITKLEGFCLPMDVGNRLVRDLYFNSQQYPHMARLYRRQLGSPLSTVPCDKIAIQCDHMRSIRITVGDICDKDTLFEVIKMSKKAGERLAAIRKAVKMKTENEEDERIVKKGTKRNLCQNLSNNMEVQEHGHKRGDRNDLSKRSLQQGEASAPDEGGYDRREGEREDTKKEARSRFSSRSVHSGEEELYLPTLWFSLQPDDRADEARGYCSYQSRWQGSDHQQLQPSQGLVRLQLL